MRKMALSVALSLAAGFVGGATATWLVRPQAAYAQTSSAPVLPPIFAVGATLTSTIGEVQIQDVAGEWIRVRSLNSADDPVGGNWWINVPAQPGAWRPEAVSSTTKPVR